MESENYSGKSVTYVTSEFESSINRETKMLVSGKKLKNSLLATYNHVTRGVSVISDKSSSPEFDSFVDFYDYASLDRGNVPETVVGFLKGVSGSKPVPASEDVINYFDSFVGK